MKKFLKSKGFKKTWDDDHNGYWWEKKIDHPYFRELTMVVDNDYKLGEERGVVCLGFKPVELRDSNIRVSPYVYTIHAEPLSKHAVSRLLEDFDVVWDVVGITTVEGEGDIYTPKGWDKNKVAIFNSLTDKDINRMIKKIAKGEDPYKETDDKHPVGKAKVKFESTTT